MNGKKTTFPIIAWYCLENPIAIGLLGYGAKTIDFNLSDFKTIEKPSDKKRITQEELNLKIRELYFKQ